MTLSVASAQNASVELTDPPFEQLVAGWNKSLDEIDQELEKSTLSREQTNTFLATIDGIRQQVSEMSHQANSEALIAQRMLAALGPAPAEGEPGEDQATHAERQQIRAQITRYESRYKRCNLILTRTNILVEQIAAAEKNTILLALQKRVLWSFELLPAGLSQLHVSLGRNWAALTHDWQELSASSKQKKERLLVLVIFLLFGLVVVWLVRGWLLRHFGRDPSVQAPGHDRQLSACVTEFFARGLIPAALIGVGAVALQSGLLWSGIISAVIHTLMLISVQWLLILPAASAALAPHNPQWRLNKLTDSQANGIYHNLLWLLLLTVTMEIFKNILNPPTVGAGIRILSEDMVLALFASQNPANILLGGGSILSISLIMLSLLQPRYWNIRGSDETNGVSSDSHPTLTFSILLWLARLALIGCILLGFVGYIGGGLLISVRICWTLASLCFFWLTKHLFHASLRQLSRSDSRVGASLRKRLMLDEAGVARLVFWLQLLINTVLLVITVIVLLLIWGVPKALLGQFRDMLLGGFEIGGLLLSPITIGGAIAVFALVLTIMRLLSNFFSQKVLVQTKLDIGVRDALATVSGYIGVFIATLVALTVLGFDFGKLALVLGGLSVGIGFGLQHIVNNFISGLILLFQRPIKSGDWVVVGSHQGFVKHIAAISTEIQTFDNASVLVPNSIMASTEVLNWTHKSTLGRVVVAVGVSYDSDPEQVRDILLACAELHPDILSRPEPRVVFLNFGSSSLDFDIRFYIREIDQALRVASEMRFTIRKAFDDANIVIPFPQADVHLHHPDKD